MTTPAPTGTTMPSIPAIPYLTWSEDSLLGLGLQRQKKTPSNSPRFRMTEVLSKVFGVWDDAVSTSVWARWKAENASVRNVLDDHFKTAWAGHTPSSLESTRDRALWLPVATIAQILAAYAWSAMSTSIKDEALRSSEIVKGASATQMPAPTVVTTSSSSSSSSSSSTSDKIERTEAKRTEESLSQLTPSGTKLLQALLGPDTPYKVDKETCTVDYDSQATCLGVIIQSTFSRSTTSAARKTRLAGQNKPVVQAVPLSVPLGTCTRKKTVTIAAGTSRSPSSDQAEMDSTKTSAKPTPTPRNKKRKSCDGQDSPGGKEEATGPLKKIQRTTTGRPGIVPNTKSNRLGAKLAELGELKLRTMSPPAIQEFAEKQANVGRVSLPTASRAYRVALEQFGQGVTQ